MSTTLVTPAPAPAAPESPEPPIWPITVEMYTRMIEADIIGEDDPVYLWEGQLVQRMAPHRPHSSALKRLYDSLLGKLAQLATLDREQPLAFQTRPSVPQPDLMVLRGRLEDYSKDFPTTANACILIEIADSTLRKDRNLVAYYAAEGVPVYWVVNVAERCIEVYSEPAEGSYRKRDVFPADAAVPIVIDGREVGRIDVREVLP